ncbi:MAG: hypothetical protein QOD26_1241 [Betaproteobacteria bacterium]|nr:hypothetical protein [Betaproteobacteria bacterium]
MKGALALLVTLAVLAVSACGEREQTTEFKRGKYQGKPDSPSWSNAPLAYESGKWTQGDRASWEESIKNRQLAQHEHKRIYQ